MDNAIYRFVTLSDGTKVKAGVYLVGPRGQLVSARLDTPIKSGWRLASQSDIDQAERAAAALADAARAQKADEDARAVAESEARDAE